MIFQFLCNRGAENRPKISSLDQPGLALVSPERVSMHLVFQICKVLVSSANYDSSALNFQSSFVNLDCALTRRQDYQLNVYNVSREDKLNVEGDIEYSQTGIEIHLRRHIQARLLVFY